MDARIIAILGASRARHIVSARTLSGAMDAAELFEHHTSGTQSLFSVPEPKGGSCLATIEAQPSGRGWTVWMQPPAFGLKAEQEWRFKDRASAVAWAACVLLVGLKDAEQLPTG